MRSFNGLLTALFATCCAAQVAAAPVLVDSFESPDMTLIDKTVDGVGVSVSGGPVNPPANNLTRRAEHNLLAGSNANGLSSNVVVGSAADVAGTMQITNGSNADSTALVSWVLPVGFINDYAAGPLALAFDVLAASGNATFEVSWQGTSLGSRAIADFAGAGSTLALLALTEALQDSISNPSGPSGVLQIAFNGDVGFGLMLDNVRFQAPPPVTPPGQVPVPGTLALVALALAGTATVARRRRS